MNEIDIKKNYMYVKSFMDKENLSNMISVMITEYYVEKFKGDMDYRKKVEDILYYNKAYQRIDEIFDETEEELIEWNQVIKKDRY